MSKRPFAQARNCSPCGLDKGVKPFSIITMVGKPASKAARITRFSPGEMAGETSTHPFRASSRYCFTSDSICASVERREIRTALRLGAESNALLPMPL